MASLTAFTRRRCVPFVCAAVILAAAPTAVRAAPGDTEAITLAHGSTTVSPGGSLGAAGKPHECLSADGRYVVFESEASNLVPDDLNGVADIFVRDRATGQTQRVNVGVSGAEANRAGLSPAISANGRYVVFDSAAANLVPNDTNGDYDVFLYDRTLGRTERVNLTDGDAQGPGGGAGLASVSGDGRYVVFYSRGAYTPGDPSDTGDVFVRDRVAGTTRRVSEAMGGGTANADSGLASISRDGRFVAFMSDASNLVPGDTNGMVDVFVRDLGTWTIERVSLANDGRAAWGYLVSISGDGNVVAFITTAPLVDADTNSHYDIYARDRQAGTTELVSVSTAGKVGNQHSFDPAVSANGRYIAFESRASNLVPGDTNRTSDVFVRDLWLKTTTRASIDSNGAEATAQSLTPAIDAEGRFVAFASADEGLVEGVTGRGVFLHETGGPQVKAYAVAPQSLDFGVQTVGTARTLDIRVTNSGTVPIWVQSVVLSGADAAQFALPQRCRGWLQPAATCRNRVKFQPTALGPLAASLVVTAADGIVRTVPLAGTSVKASFTLTPTSVDFGNVPVGSSSAGVSVRLKNTGAGVLPISSISLQGPDRAHFTRRETCPAALPPGSSCQAQVRFVPTSAGRKTAVLTVRGGGQAGSISVALSGTGT